jgi:hypothetical protein
VLLAWRLSWRPSCASQTKRMSCEWVDDDDTRQQWHVRIDKLGPRMQELPTTNNMTYLLSVTSTSFCDLLLAMLMKSCCYRYQSVGRRVTVLLDVDTRKKVSSVSKKVVKVIVHTVLTVCWTHWHTVVRKQQRGSRYTGKTSIYFEIMYAVTKPSKSDRFHIDSFVLSKRKKHALFRWISVGWIIHKDLWCGCQKIASPEKTPGAIGKEPARVNHIYDCFHDVYVFWRGVRLAFCGNAKLLRMFQWEVLHIPVWSFIILIFSSSTIIKSSLD